jgi:hypothetical protein
VSPQRRQILLANVAHPHAVHQFGNEGVEEPEAVGDARPQCDRVTRSPVLVQENEHLAPYDLQFPKRHGANHPRDLVHQTGPEPPVPLHGGGSLAMLFPRLSQDADDAVRASERT